MLAQNISTILGKVVLEADGAEFGAADIKALFAKRSAATKLSEDLREQYLKAVQAERETMAATENEASLVRDALLLRYRSSPEVLAKIGLAPPKKRKPLGAKAMADKVAKAEATRKSHEVTPPAVATPPTPIAPPAPVVVNGSH